MRIPFDGPMEAPRPSARQPQSWTRLAPSPPLALSLDTRLRPRFGHVHPAASLSISLMRTTRVPGEHRGWPLHATLGRFPMARVGELAPEAAAAWSESGGVAVPMHPNEAAWLRFDSPTGYPFAIKVAAGTVDAVSGGAWVPGLTVDPPNHIVVPAQSWLDGIRVGDGRLRQFVAEPPDRLDGSSDRAAGASALRAARMQIVVTPMRADEWARRTARPRWPRVHDSQADRWRPGVWDGSATLTCVVRLVPARSWMHVAGESVPHAPIPDEVYRRTGISP